MLRRLGWILARAAFARGPARAGRREPSGPQAGIFAEADGWRREATESRADSLAASSRRLLGRPSARYLTLLTTDFPRFGDSAGNSRSGRPGACQRSRRYPHPSRSSFNGDHQPIEEGAPPVELRLAPFPFRSPPYLGPIRVPHSDSAATPAHFSPGVKRSRIGRPPRVIPLSDTPEGINPRTRPRFQVSRVAATRLLFAGCVASQVVVDLRVSPPYLHPGSAPSARAKCSGGVCGGVYQGFTASWPVTAPSWNLRSPAITVCPSVGASRRRVP